MRRSMVWFAILAVSGCGPFVAIPGADEEVDDAGATDATPGGPMTSPPTATAVPTTGEPPDSTTTGAPTSEGPGTFSSAESGEETISFIAPDDTICSCECDVWAQDCPRGEKCMPWANDGGNAWNAVKCTPLVPDPQGVGDPCSVEESPVSGIDDCGPAQICWDVDLDTLEGECIAMCRGSADAPECPPGSRCHVANDGTLILCLPECNPLLTECGDGRVCIQYAPGEFVCSLALDPGPYGEPCLSAGECEDGLGCAPAGAMVGVGECTAVGRCCTTYCDVTIADPDAACPDQALGQACVPLWDEGEAPPGYEALGWCLIQ